MSMQSAADGLAERLFTAERVIDEAVTGTAALLVGMVETRTAARLPATVGEGAQRRAAEAVEQLSAARRAVGAAHAELDRLARAYDVVLTGPVEKPEEDTVPGGGGRDAVRAA